MSYYLSYYSNYLVILSVIITSLMPSSQTLLGETLFLSNCSVCHLNRNNLILPEKDLKKTTLTLSGINSLESLSYLITNGKNGMPAFGERLKESDIEEIASYIIQQNGRE